jgi:uncharacterized protein (DUF4415 family)
LLPDVPYLLARSEFITLINNDRPKTGNARTSISLRLPPETLARWKATGPGWQTRMAEILRKAV